MKVPDGIDADLMGPLGCSISTGAGTILNELQPRPDSSVAIFGCGNVGLAAVMAARLSPATTIIAGDTNPARLALARELGATHVVGGDRTVAEIRDITDGALDYAMETTDGVNLVADAVEALGIRGVCAVVGGAKATAKITVPHENLLLSGKTIRGVMGGGGTTPDFHLALMRLQAQGRFPLERLVRRYPFAELNQAVDDSDSGEAIKPILMMEPGAV